MPMLNTDYNTWLMMQKLISKMDQLKNMPVFKSIQISLACQACIDAEKTHEWYGSPTPVPICSSGGAVCAPALNTSPTGQSAHDALGASVARCR